MAKYAKFYSRNFELFTFRLLFYLFPILFFYLITALYLQRPILELRTIGRDLDESIFRRIEILFYYILDYLH